MSGTMGLIRTTIAAYVEEDVCVGASDITDVDSSVYCELLFLAKVSRALVPDFSVEVWGTNPWLRGDEHGPDAN